MDVKIDISENVRFIEKHSIIGVSDQNGTYKKNLCLPPRVKKRIPNYASKTDKIHSSLIFHLIKGDITKFKSIQICPDVSRNKLFNNLRRLFKGNKYWINLEKSNKVKVCPVKKSYVDGYVKKIRKGKETRGEEIQLQEMLDYLRVFSDDDEKKRNKI